MHVTFLMQSYKRPSSVVRGSQISAYLEDSSVCTYDDMMRKLPKERSIIVVIKNHNTDIAGILKGMGHIIVYDVVDAPTYNYDERSYRDFNIYDAVIATSLKSAASIQERATKTKVIAIPHHSMNFENNVNPIREENLLVGYIGGFSHNNHIEKLQSMIRARGARFEVINPTTREECVKAYQNYDISFSYTDSQKNRELKPNEKLTNGQSFGVPMVCSPHQSYIEYGGQAGDSWLVADTGDQFVQGVEELIVNSTLRTKIRTAGLAAAEPLHVSKVAKMYDELRRNFT